MIKEAIIKLSQKQDLTYEEAEQVMDEIMEGKATDVQKSAYLTALSMKGETIDEITASAAGMRSHCVKLLHNMNVLEIVGTGGDGANSFNISTTAAMVIAAAGVPVAKHGNRAASSRSGAADVLEALGTHAPMSRETCAQLYPDIPFDRFIAHDHGVQILLIRRRRKHNDRFCHAHGQHSANQQKCYHGDCNHKHVEPPGNPLFAHGASGYENP